jgi:hypothetical protein
MGAEQNAFARATSLRRKLSVAQATYKAACENVVKVARQYGDGENRDSNETIDVLVAASR